MTKLLCADRRRPTATPPEGPPPLAPLSLPHVPFSFRERKAGEYSTVYNYENTQNGKFLTYPSNFAPSHPLTPPYPPRRPLFYVEKNKGLSCMNVVWGLVVYKS
ncbi:hypothetical protein H6P81_014445 [Aristolochia fimbriata]|uniref:Uncharacterized protein n=1 Tax=Aristolochia fimbriata TaxID=158543 RepID=A0AAV7EL61_ARIFI|nr:hypothetical protein H6P81_014445 [Aristolochia fimbriata]